MLSESACWRLSDAVEKQSSTQMVSRCRAAEQISTINRSRPSRMRVVPAWEWAVRKPSQPLEDHEASTITVEARAVTNQPVLAKYLSITLADFSITAPTSHVLAERARRVFLELV